MNIMGEIRMSAEQVIDECKSVPSRNEVTSREVKNSVWKPISHSNAVETILRGFEKHEIKVLDSAFALGRKGHALVGGFEVVGDCLPETNFDGNWQMAIKHSNDLKEGFLPSAGAKLMVCTNGMITGDKLARHKHTINFDFESWIVDETIPSFIDQLTNVSLSVDKMRDYELSDEKAYRLILEAADNRILPYARAIDVYREWEYPTFANDDFQKNSMWKLYNDCTYVSQRCKPERQHEINKQMHGLLLSAC